MKQVFILLAAIGFVFLTNNFTQAQLDSAEIVEKIKNELDASPLGAFNTAAKSIESAYKALNDLKESDKGLEKHFQKRVKKGERKAIPSKKIRIEIAEIMTADFEKIQDILAMRLRSVVFHFESDKQATNNLVKESASLMKSASLRLNKYNGMSRRNLRKTSYEKLKREFETIRDLQTEALKKQFTVYHTWFAQDAKKQKNKEDDEAWARATRVNTSKSYEEYIANFPFGKYLVLARENQNERNTIEAKEMETEEAALANAQQQNGLMFRVQLIAVGEQLSQEEITVYYSGEEEVLEIQQDGYYKYSVGVFTSYEEAKAFTHAVGGNSFVVAFSEGQPIPVGEAIKMLKKEPENQGFDDEY